jgi:hypothetical protein
MGQDEDDESEDKPDSGPVLDDGCSPMSWESLSKRLAANKAYRQRLAECEEEPAYYSQMTESPGQTMETGMMHLNDENNGVGQGTPAGSFLVRQDSSLGGSGQVSDGQVTARLQTVAEDGACSAPATSPQLSQTGGAADCQVLSQIAVPASVEQLQVPHAAVHASAQADTQSLSGLNPASFGPILLHSIGGTSRGCCLFLSAFLS